MHDKNAYQGRKKLNIWVLRPFQENFSYIEPTVNQRWAKTGGPREKPPDLLVQNLASRVCPERGSNHRVNALNHLTTETVTKGVSRDD